MRRAALAASLVVLAACSGAPEHRATPSTPAFSCDGSVLAAPNGVDLARLTNVTDYELTNVTGRSGLLLRVSMTSPSWHLSGRTVDAPSGGGFIAITSVPSYDLGEIDAGDALAMGSLTVALTDGQGFQKDVPISDILHGRAQMCVPHLASTSLSISGPRDAQTFPIDGSTQGGAP